MINTENTRRTKIPKLSLYRTEKSKDYTFFDRNIREQLEVGGTFAYVHKYLGPTNQGASADATQPQYANMSPTNIQDLLFLENRDRTYDPDIVRIKVAYKVQDLDFDLSQFGLFLNNDILFMTAHLNSMIDVLGRKLIVGDVIELPHLVDFHPLDPGIPVSLKRFYQVTDGNFASEGFSSTWYPHLWRIKCEHLVNSQEFSQVLNEPNNKDNYLGQWNATTTYPAGYVVSFGDVNYTTVVDTPVGVPPPNPTYWAVDTVGAIKDAITSYNKNIIINDAVLQEAHRHVEKSGYDNTHLYVVPEYAPGNEFAGRPAPPVDLSIPVGAPGNTGTVIYVRTAQYVLPSAVVKIINPKLLPHQRMSMEWIDLPPTVIGSGSGPVSGERVLVMTPITATGPYGSGDNTFVTGDQVPTNNILPEMDYRADCDPRFIYIARVTPLNFGYTKGYLTGDGKAPNGLPTGVGIVFPPSPKEGDYFLRIDYKPQLLFRWNGAIWVRISENVRTETGFTVENESQVSGFINNRAETTLSNGTKVPQKQGLSTVLGIVADPLPPR
jgi:hypothetical protein